MIFLIVIGGHTSIFIVVTVYCLRPLHN